MRAISTAASAVRHAIGAVGQALLIAAIVVALFVAVSAVGQTAPVGATDALAARGGNASRHGAALMFDPPIVTVGSQYAVVGSGFRANTWVALGAYYADTTWWASGVTDGDGNIRLALSATSPGEVRHEAMEQTRHGFRLKATATLTVSP